MNIVKSSNILSRSPEHCTEKEIPTYLLLTYLLKFEHAGASFCNVVPTHYEKFLCWIFQPPQVSLEGCAGVEYESSKSLKLRTSNCETLVSFIWIPGTCNTTQWLIILYATENFSFSVLSQSYQLLINPGVRSQKLLFSVNLSVQKFSFPIVKVSHYYQKLKCTA